MTNKEEKYIDDLIKAKEEVKELKEKLENYNEVVFYLSLFVYPTKRFKDPKFDFMLQAKAMEFIVEKFLNIRCPTNDKDFPSKEKEVFSKLKDFQEKQLNKNKLNK